MRLVFLNSFILIAALLFLTIILQKTIVKNSKEMRLAGMITLLFGLYIVFSFVSAFFFKGWISCLMIFFAVSPFIIGQIVKYQTEKKLSFIQAAIILSSGFFVLWANLISEAGL